MGVSRAKRFCCSILLCLHLGCERTKPEIEPMSNIEMIVTNYDDEGASCAEVLPSGACFTSLADLQRAVPQLPELARQNPLMIARAINWIEDSRSFMESNEEAIEWWNEWVEPDDVLQAASFTATATPDMPDISKIEAPRVESDKLVFFTVHFISREHGGQAWRAEVDFSQQTRHLRQPTRF